MRWPNCVRSSRPLALRCTRLFPAQNLLQKSSERQPANYKASLTSGVARACNFAIFIVEQFAGRVGGSCPSAKEVNEWVAAHTRTRLPGNSRDLYIWFVRAAYVAEQNA